MVNFNWLARDPLLRHSSDMRQFIDFRQSTLPTGARLVEAYNASGLSFSLLPDRGLDMWAAHYNGVPLTWLSMGSPHAPDFGASWRRQFNGGLLTTCGLRHVGPPETDPATGEQRGLHGLYTRSRAHDLAQRGFWQDEQYILELTATIPQARLSGEQLALTRTVRMVLGDPAITITDRVVNAGGRAAPLMVLYHINLGYPLVRAGAELHTPHHAVYPRDDEARQGVDTWAVYDAPVPHYDEQVFFHHLKADEPGDTVVMLGQGGFGLEVGWDTSTLPYFTQWKNTRTKTYVCGLEPGNCIPEGQNAARESGRLATLEPGAEQQFTLRLRVLDGAEAVVDLRERIRAGREHGTPVAACQLDDFAE